MPDTPSRPRPPDARLADEAVALVRRWLAEAADVPADRAAHQLAGLLGDPAGLPFAVRFIDGVVRPEDNRVAARTLAAVARDVPTFLPRHLRAAVRLGGAAGRVAPDVVVPVARRALRQLVGHLVVDASDDRLGAAIARLSRPGVRLNINPLGEAVLGEREAGRRLEQTFRLLRRDDVDYVSVKVSAVVAPHSPWAFDEAVDEIVDRLRPLYEYAAASQAGNRPKFINLDMEEYRDLDLTLAVFTRLLDLPGLTDLEAGIVLQAYLPDALWAMEQLQEWAAARRSAGGAAIKVRLVKGANLPMEHVEASLRGWPPATWGTKQQTDAHYKRVLDRALRPEHIANVRLGVAGHNLFDIALAWLLAGERGVRDGIDVEMLLGMAQNQAEVVRRAVGRLLLYTPVVHPREFDVAIAYLVRRLEEGASQDNIMSALFELGSDDGLFRREEERFRASLADLPDAVPARNRTQDRGTPPQSTPHRRAFGNAQDTDPALPQNRAWARAILDRVPGSRLGAALVDDHTVRSGDELDRQLAGAVAAAADWAARSGDERAVVLERVADQLEARRAELCEVMAAEAGKTVDQADIEVTEAVDFARYYAAGARGLERIEGARFVPARLTVVTPPWNFPVAIPAGSTLAALATGSAVVLKPAAEAARCGSVLAEAMWSAGVPREVLRLVHVTEQDLGRALVGDPRVDRVILTGAFETAELFRSFRVDLPLLAETSGKNAVVVTPSADLDLAARDVAHSAFDHAGQKCSAASLVILVGSVARSTRFRNQLLDAVASLRVGWPEDPTTQVGPLIAPADGKLLEALTTLGEGEQWAVRPRALDDAGRLWSPGVVTGVRPGSRTHQVEYFGPVLGVMTAATLDEAIEIQNDVPYGLTAGLHSLDPAEVSSWLGRVQAGNLYVNRGITGAVVRRQPFGGWKRSSVGPGFKAGGPNYLLGLGSWGPAPMAAAPVAQATEPLDGRVRALRAAVRDVVRPDELRLLDAALADDAHRRRTVFAPADPSALTAERNVLRYLPTPVHVRVGDAGTVVDAVRVLAAALVAGSPVDVSSAVPLPGTVVTALAAEAVEVRDEPEAAWLERMDRERPARIRLVGGDPAALAQRLGGAPDVAVFDQPVTGSGRLEQLPFYREQSVSITRHRFGTPTAWVDRVL